MLYMFYMAKKTGEPEMKNYYDICERAGCAIGLAAWAWAIVCHLVTP